MSPYVNPGFAWSAPRRGISVIFFVNRKGRRLLAAGGQPLGRYFSGLLDALFPPPRRQVLDEPEALGPIPPRRSFLPDRSRSPPPPLSATLPFAQLERAPRARSPGVEKGGDD